MRKIKQLPPVPIAPDDYQFLENTCRELLAGVRHLADDGTPLYFPDTSGEYSALWTRDFCYMVEYAGPLLPAEEVLAGIDYLLAGQREDGTIPDRVRGDGVAVYCAGREEQPLSEDPPTDNAQFMVKLLDAYYLLTGDVAGFLERAPQLFRAMETVPLSADGLVYIDPNRLRSPYGFTDCVAKTGKVLFSSLLYWEAARRLALRLQELEEHEEARIWFEAATHTLGDLDQFYEEESGLYWAASEDCHQYDLWGTAYAAVLRLASKRESRLIGQFFLDNAEVAFWRGHLRHLPRGEYWERMLFEIPAETYQNGAYWAVPTGWAAQTIALVDKAAAAALVTEVLEVWREGEVWECMGPEAEPKGPGLVASATNLLGAVTSQ